MSEKKGEFIRVSRNPAARQVDVYIGKDEGNRIGFAGSVSYLLEPKDGEEVQPTLSVSLEMAQELLQSLWDQGFRPNRLSSESDARFHLEDMRKIVSKVLEVEL